MYTIHDGSFSLKIDDEGTAEHAFGIYLNKRRFRILYHGSQNLPGKIVEFIDRLLQNNDTIVQDVDDLSIVFTRKEFMEKIKRKCSCCGQELPE